jgi:hypothetical protein
VTSVSCLCTKPTGNDGHVFHERVHRSYVRGRRGSVSRAPRRPLWVKRLRGLSRVLLFSGHDERLAPRHWKNSTS